MWIYLKQCPGIKPLCRFSLCLLIIRQSPYGLEVVSCSGLSPFLSASPFNTFTPFVTRLIGLVAMHLGCTGEPIGPKGLAPLLTATAAAATAGATVGAVGDIEELGEKASFNV